MGARQKLNQAAINGCLIVGGLVGLFSQSWLAFFIATTVLAGLSLHGGEIRPNPTERSGASGRRTKSSRPTSRFHPPDRR